MRWEKFMQIHYIHALIIIPDSKVHGANMGPIWVQQDPGGPHVGPMNFSIWDVFQTKAVNVLFWKTNCHLYSTLIILLHKAHLTRHQQYLGDIHGLIQKRRNSSVLAVALGQFCMKSSMSHCHIGAKKLPESTLTQFHYSDVIMSAMASQITSVPIVYSTVCSGADKRTHRSPASLAFVRGIHRWPVNSTHKGPVTRKMFPFNDIIMLLIVRQWLNQEIHKKKFSVCYLFSLVYPKASNDLYLMQIHLSGRRIYHLKHIVFHVTQITLWKNKHGWEGHILHLFLPNHWQEECTFNQHHYMIRRVAVLGTINHNFLIWYYD